ncbi:MAG TPA: cellulose binding domain-containing protein [Micromonosporaceae bacterium]
MTRTLRRTLAGCALVATVGLASFLYAAPAQAASVTATFARTTSWDTGYEAKYTITNGTAATISSWRVEFDLPTGSTLGSYWEASVTSSGSHHTAVNRSWNGTVAPGASVTFGFIITGTGNPTNCTVNGNPCGGGTPPASPSPTANPTPSASPTGSPAPPPGTAGMAAAPYLYLGWGNPPSPTSVMSATGIRWFTMAFILSSGGCTAAWDGQRPLAGGVDESTIRAIRSAGGDVLPSIGGWSGNKLGPNCATPEALAGAYQRVIDAYQLKAIDIDIENSDEFENEAVQDRILNALKIVEQRNPGITTIVTFGTTTSGPSWWGQRLIRRAKELAAPVDVFTIMPFDFGGNDMYADTVSASEGLKNHLMSTFGWSAESAYRHMGISSMNGRTDVGEIVTPQVFTRIRDWATARHLARLSFWSVNRDRPCPGGGTVSHCSGIDQQEWQFTRILSGYSG